MKNIPSLQTFLSSKPLYYKEIDHERIHIAYDILKPHIKHPTTVHIVGTNGKGSTGRMIAYLAWRQAIVSEELGVRSERSRGQVFHISSDTLRDDGQNTKHQTPDDSTLYPLPSTRYKGIRPLRVGHYTSPHILRFNERIWLDGGDASDEVLEEAHKRLYKILGKYISEGLSYFEYTTLLAFVVFEDCDLMVLEAGLGGEYDATNVCDKELSVITPIGIDHQAFLGETIEEIAATKIRSIQTQALLAPQPYPEVVEMAKRIANNVGATLVAAQDMKRNPKSQGAQEGHPYDILKQIARAKGWPDYLIQNAMVAMQALDILDIPYDIKNLENLELFGRFYPLRDNIRIDVGHNPLAARVIVEAMKDDTVLIYNSLDDKDYEEVLNILKPKLKRVEIIHIDTQRAATMHAIEEALDKLGLPYRKFNGKTDPDEHYLVFGSFYVVEEFLK